MHRKLSSGILGGWRGFWRGTAATAPEPSRLTRRKGLSIMGVHQRICSLPFAIPWRLLHQVMLSLAPVLPGSCRRLGRRCALLVIMPSGAKGASMDRTVAIVVDSAAAVPPPNGPGA